MQIGKGDIIQPLKMLVIFEIIAIAAVLGCVSQLPSSDMVVLKVNPVIEYYPLGGFIEKSEGVFIVLNGSIPDVKESLNEIVIKKLVKPSTFSVNDDLNFVIFRGVFSTGGHGIKIERVEKQGNDFTVYATYTDPGEGLMVTQAFTHPTAIIPIGKLENGDYKAMLKVTWIIENKENRKIVETEEELMNLEFKVE